jgi:hypothetical protein
MLGKAERFRRWRLLIRAFVWLGLVDLGLRVAGLKRLIDLAPRASGVPARRLPVHLPVYVAALEAVAGRHVIQAHCLHKSVVLHFWLRREGLPSQLRIGVRKDRGELRAHAWVTLGEYIINDDPRAVAAFTLLKGARLDDAVWSSAVAHV